MLSFNFLNMFVAEISIIYSAYTCKRSFPRLNVSTVYTNTRYITSGFSGNYTGFCHLTSTAQLYLNLQVSPKHSWKPRVP